MNTDSPVFKTKVFPSLKTTNKSLNSIPENSQSVKLNVKPFDNSLTNTSDSQTKVQFSFQSAPKNQQSAIIPRSTKFSGLVTIGSKLLESIKNKPGTFDLGLDEDDKKMKLLKEVENLKSSLGDFGKKGKERFFEYMYESPSQLDPNKVESD